jgi:epoxyqueuosine reductase QueG
MTKLTDPLSSSEFHDFLQEFFHKLGVDLFGLADLGGLVSVKDDSGEEFHNAISFAVPMNPGVMSGIKEGPNRYYAEEYARVNGLINAISSSLAGRLKSLGYQAKDLPASDRTDPVNLKGDFPHKTAATRAGLGWIGRNCQLITKQFGPWIRLGTVFVNVPGNLEDIESDGLCSEAVTKSFCGDCHECVEACPADALVGNSWHPGVLREELLDAKRCDTWKKEHYYQFHKGHNCGICAAVCPFGTKQART